MDASDLRALAKEREARNRTVSGAGVATPRATTTHSHSRAASQQSSPISLMSAHRSIRLARSLGLAVSVLGVVLVLVLGAGWRTGLVCLLGGVGLGRGGGALLHGLLPTMLVDTARPPTAAEMTAAAAVGLYSVEGVKTVGASLASEWSLALDSLAFVCTYGKKNCLSARAHFPATLRRAGEDTEEGGDGRSFR